jgi:hypothetical protein
LFVRVVFVPKRCPQKRVLFRRGGLTQLPRDGIGIITAFDLHRRALAGLPGRSANNGALAVLATTDRARAGAAGALPARVSTGNSTDHAAGTAADAFISGTAALTRDRFLLFGDHIVEIFERPVEFIAFACPVAAAVAVAGKRVIAASAKAVILTSATGTAGCLALATGASIALAAAGPAGTALIARAATGAVAGRKSARISAAAATATTAAARDPGAAAVGSAWRAGAAALRATGSTGTAVTRRRDTTAWRWNTTFRRRDTAAWRGDATTG